MKLRRVLRAGSRLAVIMTAGTAVALARIAPAQPAEDRNAADVYREAFALFDQLSERDRELIVTFARGDSIPPDQEIRAALRRAEPVMRLLREAASIERADFGIDYTSGPGTVLPHLAPMRAGSRLFIADARVRLADGDPRAAAEAWGAALRMSDHATNDPVIINSLVGVAMFRGAHQDIRRAIDEGVLDMNAARELLDAAHAITANDPFGLVASLEGERAATSGWMIASFTGEGGLERMLDQADFFSMAGDEGEFVGRVAEMSQPELDAAIHAFDLAQERMIAAAKLGDLEAVKSEMDRLQDEALRGAYGPIPAVMMPALDKYIESMIRTYGVLNRLVDDLEIVAASPDGTMLARNAAIWYLRAIREYEALDAETVQAIDAIVTAWPRTIDEAQQLSPERATPVVEQLAVAAQIERCDFDLEGVWRRQGMLADLSHVEGMIACAKLLAADAWAHLIAESPERRREGAVRLAGLLRMTDHLATDARVQSSLAAAGIAEIGADVCDAIREHSISLDAMRIAMVRAAIGRHSRGDPFGLFAAVRGYRAVTSEWLVQRYARDGFAREAFLTDLPRLAGDRAAEIARALAPLSDEEVVAALRALDSVVEESTTQSPALARAPGLDDVMIEYGADHPLGLIEWLIHPLQRAAQAKERALHRLRGVVLGADN